MTRWKQTLKAGLLSALALLLVPAMAAADHSASSNYQVNETFFGSGGELNACSSNFCSKQAAGELTAGNTHSSNYQAQGGFNTDRFPYIQFNVSNTSTNLGTLTPGSTKTATATFSVKAYLAHGYTVVNASDPPVNDSYTMQALSSPTASSTGTEQFGINLVANTIPLVGANPSYIPDNTFSFGAVSGDYSIPNQFVYRKGDIIAYSYQSSSATTYTISYIFNVSNVTPGGTYVMHHVLVATGTY